MGLVEAPEPAVETEVFTYGDQDGEIEVLVARSLLVRPWVKDGAMLVNVEGFGRFRLHFEEDPIATG